MIEVIVNGNTQAEEELIYPCLMIAKENGVIALFDSPRCGAVIFGNNLHREGQFVRQRAKYRFEPLKGSVTIKNAD